MATTGQPPARVRGGRGGRAGALQIAFPIGDGRGWLRARRVRGCPRRLVQDPWIPQEGRMAVQETLYLSRADVERVALDMPTIIRLLEEAFREKGEGRVEMPPKPGVHTQPDAFIHAMPAYIPSLRSAGIKWVSGYPDNFKRGLPYISGLLILNDVTTGMPYAVMDCV